MVSTTSPSTKLKKKPTNISRVANAASLFKGQSLNNNLLTGPDLLANLTGILLRFRKHSIGLLANIEGMFMQVSIREEDNGQLKQRIHQANQQQQKRQGKVLEPANSTQ